VSVRRLPHWCHRTPRPGFLPRQVANSITRAERQARITQAEGAVALRDTLAQLPQLENVGWALISRLPPMRTPTFPSRPCGSRASVQSDRHRALARVYKTALRSGESSSHIFPQFSLPVCVRKVSQVGLDKPDSNCKLLFWNGLGRLPNWQSTWAKWPKWIKCPGSVDDF